MFLLFEFIDDVFGLFCFIFIGLLLFLFDDCNDVIEMSFVEFIIIFCSGFDFDFALLFWIFSSRVFNFFCLFCSIIFLSSSVLQSSTMKTLGFCSSYSLLLLLLLFLLLISMLLFKLFVFGFFFYIIFCFYFFFLFNFLFFFLVPLIQMIF